MKRSRKSCLSFWMGEHQEGRDEEKMRDAGLGVSKDEDKDEDEEVNE